MKSRREEHRLCLDRVPWRGSERSESRAIKQPTGMHAKQRSELKREGNVSKICTRSVYRFVGVVAHGVAKKSIFSNKVQFY